MPNKKGRSHEKTTLFSVFVLGLVALMGLFFWFRDYRTNFNSSLSTAENSSSLGTPLAQLLTQPSPLALRRPQGDFPKTESLATPTSIASSNPIAPPPGPRKDPFAETELVYSEETQPDYSGNFSRLRVVRTSMKYALIRVEEKLSRDASNGEERLITRSAMVADHILLHLEAGYTPEDLAKVAHSLGAEVRKAAPMSGIYLVSFDIKDPHTMEKILAELKHSPMVRSPEPDYVIRVN